MLTEKQRARLAATGCEVDYHPLARQLYATDASIYRVEPLGVAFPRSLAEAQAVVREAAAADLPVIPRGAGTGLTGGAIGEGLIVDLARYNRVITDLDLEKRTVRVGAGVVLDQLNAFLQPHGFQFGPDVATSSRATLGGMIANNSSGARAPVYGCTGSHVVSLQVLLADGRATEIGGAANGLAELRQFVQRLVTAHQEEIDQRMSPGLVKRWPGYGLDRCLREPEQSLVHILAGSEGTLAGIFSATLKIVPIPREKGVAVIFFASVAEAMQATVELLDLKPAAIEHVDRILFDQTRGQLNFQAARDLLELDQRPCEAFLIVEFYEDVAARLAEVARRNLGLRTLPLRGAAEQQLVWGLRKAGLSLLTGCPGPAKPTTCIEDVAVRPAQLPAYVEALQGILKPLHVSACFYGHAASGLLHVRPVLDLHTADGVKKLRLIADEVSALTRQFQGSLCAEHGVGIARTEFLPAHLGPRLMGVMAEIKEAFDPGCLLNPGKIITPNGARNSSFPVEIPSPGLPPGGPSRAEREFRAPLKRAIPHYKIDQQLRTGAGYELKLPFEPRLAFAARDGSFIANLEQCNGCGGCLKQAPTMCPTFIATGEESLSTRGRANIIRAALEGRFGANSKSDLLLLPELELALSNCLSCKACTAECPSNVNLSLLKAELLQARHDCHGLPLRARMISAVDWLGKLGCLAPGVANTLLKSGLVRRLLERALGFDARRPLPPYARERFDRWFAKGHRPLTPALSAGGGEGVTGPRGRVILWDDTFVRYHEPHIGQAAVKVLEAAGYEVTLLAGRVCCGRPAFSQGNLKEAARLGRHNLELLAADPERRPVIFLEPSCWAMFAEDYRELKLPGAAEIAARCFLFEQFLENLLAKEPAALPLRASARAGVIHAHCHAKALLNPALLARLAARVPGSRVKLLNTGCCGMAGAFGTLREKYALSVKVAEPLVEQIRAQPPGTAVIASGASCRHQIMDLTSARPLHLAEWLAQAL